MDTKTLSRHTYFRLMRLIFIILLVSNKAMAGGTTWVGTTSDWTVSSNWSANAVPSSTEGVTINAVVSPKVYPTIITGQTVAAKDLTIASGATLNMTGGTFNFYHDWKNSGTFNGTA